LEKTPTGITGLDEITSGGLPKGRTALICGSAGCGKTLFAMEFLVQGTLKYHEPGVFIAFEETEEELTKNVASLGFDLPGLCASKKLALDYVKVERSEIEETGEYDLEGLFIRLNHAIDSIGAKRVVLDTLEGLFAALPNEAVLRAELRRLFRWLKDKGVTAVITAERGERTMTRFGLEEYVADCVIILDHRVTEEVSTRRLRVVKYRGSVHGTNEYPFLINKNGISVLPITSLGLDYSVREEHISTGIERLDAMLAGKGYYRGSSILISGTAGVGKTSVASAFVNAAARRGERSLYFAFEESQSQILRNMRSIGINLAPWVNRGLLQFHAARPTVQGLEMHLLTMHHLVQEFKPQVVVVDPVTNLINVGSALQTRSMLVRLIDFFKTHQITALFTSLTGADSPLDQSEVGISSLIDSWLSLRNLESGNERNRGLFILKSRGMAHSNQIREFILSDKGIELVDVYAGLGTVLVGSARAAQEAREKAELMAQQEQLARRRRLFEHERHAIEAQIANLRADLESRRAELEQEASAEKRRVQAAEQSRIEIARKRMADKNGPPSNSAPPRKTRATTK